MERYCVLRELDSGLCDLRRWSGLLRDGTVNTLLYMAVGGHGSIYACYKLLPKCEMKKPVSTFEQASSGTRFADLSFEEPEFTIANAI